jgi:hypothetical protein
MPAILCGNETLSLTLMEEHRNIDLWERSAEGIGTRTSERERNSNNLYGLLFGGHVVA